MTRWRYYRYLRTAMGHSHRTAWRLARQFGPGRLR